MEVRVMLRGTIAIALSLTVIGSATASLGNLVGAWGHGFVVSTFEPKELMVATATDKTTGKAFNVVKMPNGHVMAIVPFDAMTAMPQVAPADLMR